MRSEFRLHPVTWIILFAAALEFAADLMQAAAAFKAYRDLAVAVASPLDLPAGAELAANTVKQFTYTAALLASAAMVEFLARIYAELRRIRPLTSD